MTSDSPNALSHLAEDGSARMVDVSAKPAVPRQAAAAAFIRLTPETRDLIARDAVGKGSVLAVARIAGIQAAKRTADLIPLCHPLPLAKIAVDFEDAEGGIAIRCTAKTTAQTGVEMEALTGASLAALTIYDMCKAVDPAMVIEGVRLIEKTKG